MDDGNNTVLVCLQSIPETLGHIGYKDYIFSVPGSNLQTLLMWPATKKNPNINKTFHKRGVSQLLMQVKIHTQYITVNVDS